MVYRKLRRIHKASFCARYVAFRGKRETRSLKRRKTNPTWVVSPLNGYFVFLAGLSCSLRFAIGDFGLNIINLPFHFICRIHNTSILDDMMGKSFYTLTEPAPLLTAINAASQVHLIVGSDPLAAARSGKCLAVGAKTIVIAPESAGMHYALAERIENGLVQWLRREFQDDDLRTLGREDVDFVVDAVFVTLGPNDPLSKPLFQIPGKGP